MGNHSLHLNFRQKLFLKYFCYPPPGIERSGKEETYVSDSDPLGLLNHYFGKDFLTSIQDKVVLDVGCGFGDQVVGAAREGGNMVIGVDVQPLVENAVKQAEELGLSNKVKFILKSSPLKEIDKESIDVAFSQNSFEHFKYPDKIVSDLHAILKNKGKLFITFGPPWLHPFGIHMFFMIKYPWIHFIFSEKTIMTVRKLYRDDNADKFEESEGGLNRMTIKKFIKIIKKSGFKLERLSIVPIWNLPSILTKIPIIREYISSHISAILIKD